MRKSREYLVAIRAHSNMRIWVAAANRKAACTKAESIWHHNDDTFVCNGGDIDSIDVIDAREVRS